MSENKVALITGAGQGIGRGIALKLAADGFDIAVVDLPFQQDKAAGVVAELEALGRKAIFIPADVSKKDDIAAAVDRAATELGSFDVALGIGLLWAAWQPRRALGLLPMVVALAGTMVVTATIDIVRG
ncbi:MAG: SDR family NAD(P)-dependent oxidoreductase, partial [Propionicimonas sp.]|nr:SDR family NAD(P)-dependent oxidoreductase [Propionicimonas sp.]